MRLINIKDIQAKNRQEPIEVTRIRENIKESFKRLEFQEGPHKYYIHKDNGEVVEVPSVSATTHQFVPHVDWDEKALGVALKKKLTVEEVKRQWEENNIRATNNGTSTHLFGEAYMHFLMGHPELIPDVVKPQYEKGYLIPYSDKQEGVLKFYNDIFNNDKIYPVMPEAQVYMGINENYEDITPYAGTFDMLFTYYNETDKKWKLLLYDWKGLPLDTPILTINGFKNMGELTTDDYVYDKDGKPSKVLHKSEVHYNPCMKITFNDNESIVSDYEHRWLVNITYYEKKWFRNHKIEKEVVMTTKEISDFMKKDKRNEVKIIINKPINSSNNTLIFNGLAYEFGLWLCDKLDNPVKEVLLKNNVLSKYNIKKTDYILDELLLNSTIDERWDILCGIMDCYGAKNSDKNEYYYSLNLVAPFKVHKICEQLLSYLGIHYYKFKNTLFHSYLNFKCKKIPFKCSNYIQLNKIDFTEDELQKELYRNIISVVKCDLVPTQCIEVDSPSHTYLADYNFIVTHNTNKELIKDFSRKNNIMVLPPFDNLYDEPYSYYIMQLSCYALCLEQLGYEVADRKIIWLTNDGYEKISVPDYTKQMREALKIT